MGGWGGGGKYVVGGSRPPRPPLGYATALSTDHENEEEIFLAKYLGNSYEFKNIESTTHEILSRYSTKRLKKEPSQELIVDSTYIILHDITIKD